MKRSGYIKLEIQVHPGGAVLADAKGNIASVGGAKVIGEAVEQIVKDRQDEIKAEVSDVEA